MHTSAQSNCTYRNSWSTLRVCPHLPLFIWLPCCIRYYVVDFWLEALTEHQPSLYWGYPSWIAGQRGKNNEINNTGTAAGYTALPLPVSAADTPMPVPDKNTFLSLLRLNHYANMSISFKSVGIKPPGVTPSSWSPCLSHTHTQTHLYAFCVIMFTY